MEKIQLKDVLDVKRGASLSGEYYSTSGELIRLTLGNFNYPDCGWKENKSKEDIYFTGQVRKEFILQEGDIITPLTEQVRGLLGNTATIPESNKYIQSGDIGLIIPNEEKIDKRYSYYLISSTVVKKQLDAGSQQTKIRHTSPDSIKNCYAYILEREEQVKVACLLDSINKKIEINNSINDNLQQMIYDTYMYNFLHKEPNGILSDIIIENPKSKTQVKDVKGQAGLYPFFTSGESIMKSNKYIIDGRNIFMNTGGNADVKFYIGKADYSTDTWCITTNNNLTDYLYLHLLSIKSELNTKFFKGTGLKHLQKDLLRNKEIYIPSIKEIEAFNLISKPYFDKISDNYRENEHLIQIRNYLLPLLMNGQISIT